MRERKSMYDAQLVFRSSSMKVVTEQEQLLPKECRGDLPNCDLYFILFKKNHIYL